ncbi:MAG: monofunctional biosynthetic peptidoglycan transglycosylase [Bacteroidales bacterium]|nr:monofunctional biosynthetic peptidoglycan transglycosylase [Bacteroidales bacterium]
MKKFLKFLLVKLPLAVILLSVLYVLILKWVPVWVTPIMVSRSIEYRQDPSFKTVKRWCRLEDISPELIKAVITSEDNLFVEHSGFDRKAIEQALKEKREGKRLRGASTISQQTAKNVFTLHKRTVWRKAVEGWFTLLIEWIWGKERIMEVYLNVAEMGKGVYGAQAAAQAFFGKDASALTRREAATLAACLPAPLERDAAHPSRYVSSRAATISKMIPNLKYPSWIERQD